jgi:preprotein translocase subunit Sec61beta
VKKSKLDWTGLACVGICILFSMVVFKFFNPPGLVLWVVVFTLTVTAAAAARLNTGRPFFTLARCFAPISVGGIFVATYILIQQDNALFGYDIGDVTGIGISKAIKLAQFNPNYKEQFYTAMATLFAIVLALALIKNMEDLEKAKAKIEEETSSVRTAGITLRYFEDHEMNQRSLTAKYAIHKCLLRYLENCKDDKDNEAQAENAALLLDCQLHLTDVHPADDDDSIAKADLIRRIDGLYILRLRRIEFFGKSIQPFLLVALWFMALAMLLPFLAEPLCINSKEAAAISGSDNSGYNLLGVFEKIKCAPEEVPHPRRYSQYYMIFIISAFLSFMMFMLHDVSDPRGGSWEVNLDEFGRVHELLSSINLNPRGEDSAVAESGPSRVDLNTPVQNISGTGGFNSAVTDAIVARPPHI